MTAATVLIPTHEHVEPLRHAVASVQEQTLQDFELFIVGDGVGDATRALVAELSGADRRIRFFDFPKGPRKGEIHRHQALQQAQGRFVAYLGDDDCWMPHHLAVLDALLADADFGHTLQVGIGKDREIVVIPGELDNPQFRARMLDTLFNCFDFTFAGHTMDAYRRLPYGWRTTPPDFPWTDLYMWRQFLAEPWCRARSAMVPTGINTWTHQRPHLSDSERAADLVHWRAQLAQPDFREKLWREIARQFAGQAVRAELGQIRTEAVNQALATSLTETRDAAERRAQAEARLLASLAEMRESTSWQVTGPLRAVGRLLRKISGSKGATQT